MPYHMVQEGECVRSIAAGYGFNDPNVIWNDPKNLALKQLRHGDGNVLHADDMLWVPPADLTPAQKQTAQSHTFKLKPIGRKLRILVRGADSKPLAGKPWKLEYRGGEEEGVTDGDGILETKEIPLSYGKGRLPLVEGTLTVDGRPFLLSIGFLDPARNTLDLRGVQERLHNLGYLQAGWNPNYVTPAYVRALHSFQKAHGLPVTKAIDEDTREALEAAHRNEIQPAAVRPRPANALPFTVGEPVAALPDTPVLCTAVGQKRAPVTRRADRHAVSPGTLNVLAPGRRRCGLCADKPDCLDNDYNFIRVMAQMANALDGDPEGFLAVMHHETGHTYYPWAQNPGGATGLTQLMPDTAAGFGTTIDELLDMCRIEQMVYVKEFYKYWKGVLQPNYQSTADVALVAFDPGSLRGHFVGVARSRVEKAVWKTVNGKKGPVQVLVSGEVTYPKTKDGKPELDKDGKPVMVTEPVKQHHIDVYESNPIDTKGTGMIMHDDYPNRLIAFTRTAPPPPGCARPLIDETRRVAAELQKSGNVPELKVVDPNAGSKGK